MDSDPFLEDISPKPAKGHLGTRFEWRIHHPIDGIPDRVCVEVSPKKGLLARWRFVLPGYFGKPLKWGTSKSNHPNQIKECPRGAIEGGPVKLKDGPIVLWFGALEPLSRRSSAYLVFEGTTPDYIMFGQADSTDAPPTSLEGILFERGAKSHSV